MLCFKDNKLCHEVQIRVRYADTDRMGYSYYGNYPTYFEVARTEFLRELGLTYKQLEDDGFLLPIRKMSIEYIKPALYDELLTVRTYYKKLHSIKVEFHHEVFNEQNELINTADIFLVFVSNKTRRPTQGPDYYLDLIKKHWDEFAAKAEE